jgi:hypothetical protein
MSLFDCQTSFLAYIVDYVNAHLLKDPFHPWCGSHRFTQEYIEKLGESVKCRPAAKGKVESYCKTHHIAVKISRSSDNSHNTVKDIQSSVRSESLRIVSMDDQPFESKRRILGQDGLQSQNSQQIHDITYDPSSYILNRGGGFVDVLDLFNYLDMYITDSLVTKMKKQFKTKDKLLSMFKTPQKHT